MTSDSLLTKTTARWIGQLFSGALVGQLVNTISMSILARIYPPEELGQQNIFIAIGTLISTAAAMTYPLAIVLSKDDKEVYGIVKISLGFTFITSLLVFIATFSAIDTIATLLHLPSISGWIYLLPLYIIGTTTALIFTEILAREKNFSGIAKVSWQSLLVINLGKIGIGLIYPVSTSLIAIQAVGGWIKNVLASRYTSFRIRNVISRSFHDGQGDLISLIRQYKDFPIYRAPQAIINATSQNFLLLVIGAIFSAGVVGQFSLALVATMLPVNLLGGAVNQVVYPLIKESIYDNNKNCVSDLLKITGITIMIAVPYYMLLFLYGEEIFVMVFGQTWKLGGVFCSWMVWIGLADLMNRPVSAAIPVIGMQRGLLIFEITSLSIKAMAIYFAIQANMTPLSVVTTYSIVASLLGMIFFIWAIRVVYLSLQGGPNEFKRI